MKTKQFITQYLKSPIVIHRKKALEVFFNEADSNLEFRQQLISNLKSDNYDIVLNSLKIIRSLVEYSPKKMLSCGPEIVFLAKNTNHFRIAYLCKEISDILYGVNFISEMAYKSVCKIVTPNFKQSEPDDKYFSCSYLLEYKLGNKDLKYNLDYICNAFKFEGTKAEKKVFEYMHYLGYKKEKIYRETKPMRWRDDYEGFNYKTDLYYFSEHSIQIFLMWCVKNLHIPKDAWDELLKHEREWDPSIPESTLIEGKPYIIDNIDLLSDADQWLKKRLKKEDAYKLINLSSEWTPLYENTYIKHDEKIFSRYIHTCCIKKPIGKLSKKIEIEIPYYQAENSYINELPVEAEKSCNLRLNSYGRDEELNNKLVPNYGISSEDYDEYVRIFPSPEIIKGLKLHQRKNTMEYYSGNKLVIKSIHWRDGYERSVGGRGEDRYQLGTYGQILLIKSKSLKDYLKLNKLKLLANGNILKRKEKRYGGNFDYKKENSRYKRFLVEFFG
ncbi:MAG: hypothetical protein WCK59_02485 [Candidatus Falkowbacteria bacterium]